MNAMLGWFVRPGSKTSENVRLYYSEFIGFGQGTAGIVYSKQVITETGDILGDRQFSLGPIVFELVNGSLYDYRTPDGGRGQIADFRILRAPIQNCNWPG
jgi:hypothetical protein